MHIFSELSFKSLRTWLPFSHPGEVAETQGVSVFGGDILCSTEYYASFEVNISNGSL